MILFPHTNIFWEFAAGLMNDLVIEHHDSRAEPASISLSLCLDVGSDQ